MTSLLSILLHQRRVELGLTLLQAAQRCEVAPSQMSGWVRGDCVPETHNLQKLARGLGLDLEVLDELAVVAREERREQNQARAALRRAAAPRGVTSVELERRIEKLEKRLERLVVEVAKQRLGDWAGSGGSDG